MCDILDIPGYLAAIDIEKAFDSLEHDFLLFALKKFGFNENFIHWINVYEYFNLEKGALQGDPIFLYLL